MFPYDVFHPIKFKLKSGYIAKRSLHISSTATVINTWDANLELSLLLRIKTIWSLYWDWSELFYNIFLNWALGLLAWFLQQVEKIQSARIASQINGIDSICSPLQSFSTSGSSWQINFNLESPFRRRVLVYSTTYGSDSSCTIFIKTVETRRFNLGRKLQKLGVRICNLPLSSQNVFAAFILRIYDLTP